jgi:RHS repeat-associated protein
VANSPLRLRRELSRTGLGGFIQRNQYYPSGLPWAKNPGDDTELPANANNRKYNGKEFVEMHGLDEYDSEARWYYPAIMRTTTIDPHAENYYSTSPYAWCGNNPVLMVDPDGRDWFQNDQTGAVVYVSNLHKGAEKGMTEGWQWLGDNNMFMSDKYDIANSDQILAAKNGGNIQIVVSMLLEGDKAKKFMLDRGFEFKPTQQIRCESEINYYPPSGATVVTGEKTYITEKSGYIHKGAIEDRYTPIDNLLYKDNVTVNRFQISYTTNIVKKGLYYLQPFIGFHDQRIPTVYPSLSAYPWNNKYINLFLNTRK